MADSTKIEWAIATVNYVNGRTVARCRVGGTDLSCSLVRSGHAAEWRQYGRACR